MAASFSAADMANFRKEFEKRFPFAVWKGALVYDHMVDCKVIDDFECELTKDPSQIIAFDLRPILLSDRGSIVRVYYNCEFRFNPAKVVKRVKEDKLAALKAKIQQQKEYDALASDFLRRELPPLLRRIREAASAGENSLSFVIEDKKGKFERISHSAFSDTVEEYLEQECEGVTLGAFWLDKDWYVELKW